jgi:hypothetical protein
VLATDCQILSLLEPSDASPPILAERARQPFVEGQRAALDAEFTGIAERSVRLGMVVAELCGIGGIGPGAPQPGVVAQARGLRRACRRMMPIATSTDALARAARADGGSGTKVQPAVMNGW